LRTAHGLRRVLNATRYSIDGIGKALMIGSVMLVLIVEVLNSAIEATIDRISPEQHPLAGRAKDLGSAAQSC